MMMIKDNTTDNNMNIHGNTNNSGSIAFDRYIRTAGVQGFAHQRSLNVRGDGIEQLRGEDPGAKRTKRWIENRRDLNHNRSVLVVYSSSKNNPLALQNKKAIVLSRPAPIIQLTDLLASDMDRTSGSILQKRQPFDRWRLTWRNKRSREERRKQLVYVSLLLLLCCVSSFREQHYVRY